jgi:hypothetical protein
VSAVQTALSSGSMRIECNAVSGSVWNDGEGS